MLALGVLCYESYQFNHARPYDLYSIGELQEGSRVSDKLSFDVASYQAILPIPFYHVGTDNFDEKVDGFIQQKSSLLSMQTGLPLIATLTNRSSLTRAYELLRLSSEPYDELEVFHDFDNDKPILLMVDTNYLSAYPDLGIGMKMLDEVGRLRYYAMPLSAFEERIAYRKSIITSVLADSVLYEVGSYMSTDSVENFIYEDFNNHPDEGYRGGGMSIEVVEPRKIFTKVIPASSGLINRPSKVSMWISDLRVYTLGTTFLHIQLYDTATDTLIWQEIQQIRYWLSVMARDGWSLVEVPIEISREGRLEISVHNEGADNKKVRVDELMIRPVDTDLYREGRLYQNNRYYEDINNQESQ